MINVNFAQRLKQARVMKGLSMDDLCQKLENIVSKQSISKYESGKMMPNSTVLIALSNALDVKVDYFFRSNVASLENIEFRKKTKLQVREISAIKEIIRDKVERYIEVENLCGISSDFATDFSNVIVHNEADIFPLVIRLKKEWQLGEGGINNLIEILEENKIKIIEIEASDSFDGLSGFVDNNKPIIVLNKKSDVERKRFTALHELGHILLRFDESLDGKKIEHLCHLFANEMLISREVFVRMIGCTRKDISLQELRDIQKQFGISIDALMIKARYLNVISENRHKYYCILKNKKLQFKENVNLSISKPESSSRFERLVYRTLASEIITESKAAVLLNESLTNVREKLTLV